MRYIFSAKHDLPARLPEEVLKFLSKLNLVKGEEIKWNNSNTKPGELLYKVEVCSRVIDIVRMTQDHYAYFISLFYACKDLIPLCSTPFFKILHGPLPLLKGIP